MPTYKFAPGRDELVCKCAAGQLIFQGGPTEVLFPTEERWNQIVVASHWAHTRRAEILSELEDWCRDRGIPLVITKDALPEDPTWVPPR